MVAAQVHVETEIEQEEAILFRPGQKVELKDRPGITDTIVEYDPMMVPPIWLANDPQPRYPEELRLIYHRPLSVGSVKVGSCKVTYVDFQGRVKLISKSC